MKATQLLREFGIQKEIRPETLLVEDLEIDSLDIAEIALMIELKFGIEVLDEDIKKIRTVSDLEDFILTRCK